MGKRRLYKLKDNPKYHSLVAPLRESEVKKINQQIIIDGYVGKVPVWGSTLLGEYEKYYLYREWCVPFDLYYVQCKNQEEALLWVCKTQLERTDLNNSMRNYLIGKRYNIECALTAHDAAVNRKACTDKHGKPIIIQNFEYEKSPHWVAASIAKKFEVGIDTILRYSKYARAIDYIRLVESDYISLHLSGAIQMSMATAISISEMTEAEIHKTCSAIAAEKSDRLWRSETREYFKQLKEKKDQPQIQIPEGSIKDMPKYNPNSEIESLALTIPSWISSIERVRSVTDMNAVYGASKDNLWGALVKLKIAADIMMSAMRGDTNG